MKKITTTKKLKLVLASTVLLFGFTELLAQQRCGETGGVTVDSPRGRTVYEMWQDYGDTCFTPHDWDVSGKWSNVGNTLVRESLRREVVNGRVVQQPTRDTRIDYKITVNSWSGNVYHGAYGWWSKDGKGVNNVVEWYVVDSYRNIADPTYGMTKVGNPYTIGKATYQIYTRNMVNAPSVWADSDNFTQIKCVRTTSKSRTASGGMHLRAHFNKINSIAKITDQTLYEISYKIEGFGGCDTCTSSANFRLNATFTQLKELDDVANEATISVSPNPTNGAFKVNTNSENAIIKVFDISGRLMLQLKSTEAITALNESRELPTGMYIISVTGNGITTTEKLVVQ